MLGRFANRNSVKPMARTEGLSITTSGDETLVYDRERYVIHRLSSELASIWSLADGTRDLKMLALEARVSERTVKESIQQLTAMGLMQGEVAGASRLTRRRILAGTVGAVAAGTFIAPVAASSCLKDKLEECGTCKNLMDGTQETMYRYCRCMSYGPDGCIETRWTECYNLACNP